VLNQSAFDAPQSLPFQLQQAAGSSSGSASDVRQIGGSVFSQGHPYEQIRPSRDSTAQLRTLQRHYLVLDRGRRIMDLLAEEPALFTLLNEAVRPLQIAFGERRLFHVRMQYSEDDSLLKVAVQLPADFADDPERALQDFDEKWWLDNCQRSRGALVFDYEIQDAV